MSVVGVEDISAEERNEFLSGRKSSTTYTCQSEVRGSHFFLFPLMKGTPQ